MPRKPGSAPKTGGRKKGTKNKRLPKAVVQERVRQWAKAKREGQMLGVDYVRKIAAMSYQIVRATRPIDTVGNVNKGGDLEACQWWTKTLLDAAAEVAQYESPRLSAVAIAPPQKSTRQTVTVRVFDSKGTQLDQFEDGQRVPMQIEDDRDRD